MIIASRIVSICYEHDFGVLAGRLRQFDEPQQ
jgi:hypothetical protein